MGEPVRVNPHDKFLEVEFFLGWSLIHSIKLVFFQFEPYLQIRVSKFIFSCL